MQFSIMHKMATIIFYFMASKRMNYGSFHVIPVRDHTQFLKKCGSVIISYFRLCVVPTDYSHKMVIAVQKHVNESISSSTNFLTAFPNLFVHSC